MFFNAKKSAEQAASGWGDSSLTAPPSSILASDWPGQMAQDLRGLDFAVLDFSVAWGASLLGEVGAQDAARQINRVQHLDTKRFRTLAMPSMRSTAALNSLWLHLDGLGKDAMLDAIERFAQELKRCVLLVGPGPLERLQAGLETLQACCTLNPSIQALILVAPNALGAKAIVGQACQQTGAQLQSVALSVSGFDAVWQSCVNWDAHTQPAMESTLEPEHVQTAAPAAATGASGILVRAFNLYPTEKPLHSMVTALAAHRLVVCDAHTGLVLARAETELGGAAAFDASTQPSAEAIRLRERADRHIAEHSAIVRLRLRDPQNHAELPWNLEALHGNELHVLRVFSPSKHNGVGVFALVVTHRDNASLALIKHKLAELETRIVPG
jgi:hypothetical protein